MGYYGCIIGGILIGWMLVARIYSGKVNDLYQEREYWRKKYYNKLRKKRRHK